MVMRRVPKVDPIHLHKLIKHVRADLQAASDAGKIYVEPGFLGMRGVHVEIERLTLNSKVLRSEGSMEDSDMDRRAPAIYRTEYASRWLAHVPVTVQAVVDFLPITSVLDMMVQALEDDDGTQGPPPI